MAEQVAALAPASGSADDVAFAAASLHALDSGLTFPDGAPIGQWVSICTNPQCERCYRSATRQVCMFCGSALEPTVDRLKRDKLKPNEALSGSAARGERPQQEARERADDSLQQLARHCPEDSQQPKPKNPRHE